MLLIGKLLCRTGELRLIDGLVYVQEVQGLQVLQPRELCDHSDLPSGSTIVRQCIGRNRLANGRPGKPHARYATSVRLRDATRKLYAASIYQIRSYYISSSHTRLIRCLTLTGLSQARTDESGNTNFVILPHKSLHCSWALK